MLKVAVVFVCAAFPNVTVLGPEYCFHKITGGVFEKLTKPGKDACCPNVTVWSGPAFTTGAPGDRGPPFVPVVWMTSKFVALMLVRSSKQPAGQRSSGVTE